MKNLLVSASGGRTSMMMMKLLNDKYSDTKNILNIFANTGAEDERTLDFVDRCSKEWGIPIVWVEADVQEKGTGTKHKIVSFETASRKGEPFYDVCAKYGLPNPAYNHCNREMKLAPIHSYAMEYFKSKIKFENYQTAIGIRVDEIDRMIIDREKFNFIYPLISDFRLTKAHVFEFWESQCFDLQVPEHFGNCVTCFKKSDRKLATVGREREGAFDLFVDLESKFGHINAPEKNRLMYRYNRSANEIARLAFDETIQSFTEYKNSSYNLEFDFDLDEDVPCDLQCGMKTEDYIPKSEKYVEDPYRVDVFYDENGYSYYGQDMDLDEFK